jgi:hypothetical protein
MWCLFLQKYCGRAGGGGFSGHPAEMSGGYLGILQENPLASKNHRQSIQAVCTPDVIWECVTYRIELYDKYMKVS